ncbi:MAG: DNA recombination protein RmuC [Planctomycetota bacterium]|nr:DNA recombination protein RmuC [Planctomycetota bacterium]
MIDWIDALIGLGIGAGLGGAVATLWMMSRRGEAQGDMANLKARAELLEQQARDDDEALREGRQQTLEANERREVAQRELATLTERLVVKEKQFEEQRQLLGDAKKELADTFTALGAKALAANNEQFIELAKKVLETQMTSAKGDVEKRQLAIDNLVKPIKELLEKQNLAVTEIEKKRDVAYKGLEEQIKMIAASHEKLDTQTGKLVSALRRPEQRGRWGEMQLRNVVEMAGMTEHCDFEEQPQTDDPTTRDRPDLVVRVPGGGVIVVDSKVAMDAYLDALEPESDHAERLKAHAKQVQDHVTRLASKKYWSQFEHTPDFVVMFMPLEAGLYAAMQVAPDLQSKAMQDHVIVTSPTILVALLKTIAYGWHQDAAAANAKQITEVGKELYSRLRVFVTHFEKVGDSLGKANKSYNAAVGSLERNLLTSTRRLKELNATTELEIDPPVPVEIDIRPITTTELKSLPEEIVTRSSDP